MRLVFAGTPDAAVPSLGALAASDHDIVAVITRRDAPIGRKRVLTPSPVALAAAERGLETIKSDRLDEATAADGWLMIGAGETVPAQFASFTPAYDTSGLYCRKPGSRRPSGVAGAR